MSFRASPAGIFGAVVLVSLVGLVSCSPSSKSAAAASRSPEEVVEDFIQAANERDLRRLMSCFTEAARKGLESGSGFQVHEKRFGAHEVGPAVVSGDHAEVPVRVREDGGEQDMKLALKRESGAWKVYAVKVSMGDGAEFTMDFEKVGSMMEAFAETVGAEIKTAFEEAARGGSAAEIARKRAQFDAIRPFTASEYRAEWLNGDDFRGRSVEEALRELARAVDLALDPGAHGPLLEAEVTADLRGVSRLEAIESLCREIGVYPVYPPLRESSDRTASAATIKLRQGTRQWPVAHAGPFVVGVGDLVENVPHATGAIHVMVRAYGMDEGLLTLLADFGETVAFERIVDARGRSLKADNDVRYLGGGLVRNKSFESLTNIELKHLLREVESIARIEGSHKLVVPTAVETVEFDTLEKGASRQVADFAVTVKEPGANTVLDIAAPDERLKELMVRCWATDRDGNDLGILFQSASRWQPNRMQANVQTHQPPSGLRVKLISGRQVFDHPFVLREIPLARHAEMPERIEALSFAGHDAPVHVEFRAFKERDSQFPKLILRAVNHSNKDAMTLQAKFVYVDGSGKPLKDFPHTVSGPFGREGHRPVAAKGATAEVETTAFFMPPETSRVDVIVDSVHFIDGSVWQAGR